MYVVYVSSVLIVFNHFYEDNRPLWEKSTWTGSASVDGKRTQITVKQETSSVYLDRLHMR